MKAVLCTRYRSPEGLVLRDVDTPSPGPGEVLLRIRASTVQSGDWRIQSLTLPRGFGPLGRAIFGFSRPRQPILGTELAGVVESVGPGATRFRPGDEVIAFPGAKQGCHAEYRAFPESGAIAKKPAGLSFDEAAALCFGGTTALDFLRGKAKLQPGERVLVVGAAGAVGTAAVQVAKHLGAHVTGLASAPNLDLVRGLGADRVLDRARDDPAKEGPYDVVMDAVGAFAPRRSQALAKPDGRVLLVSADLPQMLAAPFARGGAKLLSGVAAERPEDVAYLADLAERGAFRPVIDSTFPLERIAEAYARVGTGRKRGNVVVTVA